MKSINIDYFFHIYDYNRFKKWKIKNKPEILWTFSNCERSRTLITFAEHSYFLVLKHLNCMFIEYSVFMNDLMRILDKQI